MGLEEFYKNEFIQSLDNTKLTVPTEKEFSLYSSQINNESDDFNLF